mmetsp:Transcript_33408/g.90455  ORF Transcript_33408/g.90455 Transcript_33408/m.90455 type:complete len:237 (+) Transcript_33408:372-1082(+)
MVVHDGPRWPADVLDHYHGIGLHSAGDVQRASVVHHQLGRRTGAAKVTEGVQRQAEGLRRRHVLQDYLRVGRRALPLPHLRRAPLLLLPVEVSDDPAGVGNAALLLLPRHEGERAGRPGLHGHRPPLHAPLAFHKVGAGRPPGTSRGVAEEAAGGREALRAEAGRSLLAEGGQLEQGDARVLVLRRLQRPPGSLEGRQQRGRLGQVAKKDDVLAPSGHAHRQGTVPLSRSHRCEFR